MSGTPTVTFSELVQDTIRVHGLHFAVRHYCVKHKLPTWQFRIFSGI